MKDVTLDIVDLLVRQIYAGIRSYTVQSVELKFNCFFLMPLMNEFNAFLRQEMEGAFDENLDGVFDVRTVRMALEAGEGRGAASSHTVHCASPLLSQLDLSAPLSASGGDELSGHRNTRRLKLSTVESVLREGYKLRVVTATHDGALHGA